MILKNPNSLVTSTVKSYVGSVIAIEVVQDRYKNHVLYKRFVDKMTFKEISKVEGISESKASKLVAEMLDEIKSDEDLYNYVRRGYEYTKKCI